MYRRLLVLDLDLVVSLIAVQPRAVPAAYGRTRDRARDPRATTATAERATRALHRRRDEHSGIDVALYSGQGCAATGIEEVY